MGGMVLLLAIGLLWLLSTCGHVNMANFPTPNSVNNRILGMVCSYDMAHMDSVYLILNEYVSMCEGGFNPKVVVVIRNPDEIVQSWHTRWQEPGEATYTAIARYYFNILKYTRNYDTLVIYFDDVIHHT